MGGRPSTRSVPEQQRAHQSHQPTHQQSQTTESLGHSSSNMSSICVQPPSHATVNTTLYPPIVAKVSTATIDAHSAWTYAQICLIDGSGQVIDREDPPLRLGSMSTTASPLYLSEQGGRRRGGGSSSSSSGGSGSNSSSHMYFQFPDVQVTQPGIYSLGVVVQYIDKNTGQVEILVQLHTERVTVHEEQVAVGRPSAKEKRILDGLSATNC
ncbi:hypothetical protein B0T25DRAFT_579949 [Lasiosphaeria hispida]|uniref:Velvet domain-containing protein n=1 Tax=Lasiosphaeria hispida TaxID=260671 RepID=A0AAJ0MGY3_9PEZI|nr:hypothetical protein B0T25DRAFT_579949 [Lasiosphaeria hispida]